IRHWLGPPDTFLRARPVAYQGPAYGHRNLEHRRGARWRPRPLHGSQPENGLVSIEREIGMTDPKTATTDRKKDMNDQQQGAADHQDENKLIAQRRDKLQALRAQGQAFP